MATQRKDFRIRKVDEGRYDVSYISPTNKKRWDAKIEDPTLIQQCRVKEPTQSALNRLKSAVKDLAYNIWDRKGNLLYLSPRLGW